MVAPVVGRRSAGRSQGWADCRGGDEGLVGGDVEVVDVEDRGHDRGAVAAGAVHPEPAVRDVGQMREHLMDWHVDRILDVSLVELVSAADVDDGDVLAFLEGLVQVGEGRPGECCQTPCAVLVLALAMFVLPILGPPVAMAAGRSWPMQLTSRWTGDTSWVVSPSRVTGVPQAISQPSRC